MGGIHLYTVVVDTDYSICTLAVQNGRRTVGCDSLFGDVAGRFLHVLCQARKQQIEL